jgi:restriction endonuclease S subunit
MYSKYLIGTILIKIPPIAIQSKNHIILFDAKKFITMIKE